MIIIDIIAALVATTFTLGVIADYYYSNYMAWVEQHLNTDLECVSWKWLYRGYNGRNYYRPQIKGIK